MPPHPDHFEKIFSNLERKKIPRAGSESDTGDQVGQDGPY
jgi:hypothetical protein